MPIHPTFGGSSFIVPISIRSTIRPPRPAKTSLKVGAERADGRWKKSWLNITARTFKGTPSKAPRNEGELGPAEGERSAKRRDIEDEGYFTRCFSYNSNTFPSPNALPADRRIYIRNFKNPDDLFSRFILQRLRAFHS